MGFIQTTKDAGGEVLLGGTSNYTGFRCTVALTTPAVINDPVGLKGIQSERYNERISTRTCGSDSLEVIGGWFFT
jgi:hypothetical protein